MTEETITLYKHTLGKEMGLIHLVIANPQDPEDEITMVLTSERTRDNGVVFTVDTFRDVYEEMCGDFDVETLEGAILSTFGDQIQIEEVPEEPPPQRPEPNKKKNNLRVLQTPNMWKHKWGRCCCVRRGDKMVPVTPEAIAKGDVPWWNSPYSPFQLDLIDAAHDPEHKAMHVLYDDDTLCGRCGHHVWCVFNEDVPEELPKPPKYREVPDPLCDDTKALDEICWASKGEAWEIFYSDEHNRDVIQNSQLAIERANQRKRFSQEKKFDALNRAQTTGRNVYTVKQAFYTALGRAKSGTWADLDLGMLRLVKGLEDVDIPVEILDMVRLDDDGAQRELQEKTEQRATKATVDQDAQILEFMLDDEATDDDGMPVEIDVDDVANAYISSDEDETEDDDEIPEIIEPLNQRPKAVPRVVKNKTETERPQPKGKIRSNKKNAAKKTLIDACTQLQSALTAFVKTLQEDDEEDDDSSNGGTRKAGG